MAKWTIWRRSMDYHSYSSAVHDRKAYSKTSDMQAKIVRNPKASKSMGIPIWTIMVRHRYSK